MRRLTPFLDVQPPSGEEFHAIGARMLGSREKRETLQGVQGWLPAESQFVVEDLKTSYP